MRLSLDIPSSYYQTAQKRLTIILIRALGSQPVPSTSPTNQCVQGGSGTTMADQRMKVRRPAASSESTRLMPGRNPISQSNPCRRQKWKLLGGA